jgi:hypothetical protein
MTDREEFYRDILDGLATWLDSALIADILATVSRHPEPDLGNALNRNQVGCKLWLADALQQSLGTRFGTITLLGGWFGVLAAILLHDRRFAIDRVESIDIDPRCAPVAQSLNACHARTGRFVARTADMLALDYAAMRRAAATLAPRDATTRSGAAKNDDTSEAKVPSLVINTSCEHLVRFADWWARIPSGQWLVLQSNDYRGVPGHVNCVDDLSAFRAQAPMREVVFAGTREHKRYRRFMLIGLK